MKSQRFGISRFPFKSAKQTAQGPLNEEEKQPTQEEQLASVIYDEELDSGGEECELHVYEKRFDTRGEEVFLRAGTKSEFKPPKRKSHRACLVLTRHYDFSAELDYTELEIQSRHIINALREVIGTYDGVDFTSKFVTIEEPPRCLFHYQHELWEHAEASDNQQLKSHMQLCLQYMKKTLHQETKIFDSLMSNVSLFPELEHHHLWMVFKPGCLVYEKINGLETLSRLRSIYGEEDDDSPKISSWKLYTERIHFIKNEIGLVHHSIKITRYNGCKPVCELTAVPLHFHPENERIQQDLLERGRKFLSLCGIHHCFYDGVARMCSKFSPKEDDKMHTSIRHRIMLDVEQYSRVVQRVHAPNFIFGTRVYSIATEATPKLSDEDTMTCCSYLPGYSLELMRWGLFSVADVKEVAYNDKAFHGLVLLEEKKKLISSLVGRFEYQPDDGFDDLIKGKGRGLIFLLHGPPGVGKTYTAESIADHTRRPLLKISSGELGGPGSWVEEQLSRLFSLATRWNSIMLLDEADVFMQERALDSLERNWLVSILLRVLEYYEGIIFLTTNRANTMDPAFKSRIHLSISYPHLSTNARRELWKSSIERASHGQSPEWLTMDFLDHLAEKNANGREIKNMVRIGHALARNAKRDIETSDLLQALGASKQFDADFGDWSEQRKTKETSSN